MKDKAELKKRITDFRDSFKEYLEVCREVWSRYRSLQRDDEVWQRELKQREALTEKWGQLEGVFRKINAPMITVVPAIGYKTMFIDEALSSDFDNSLKGEYIQLAIGSATKAIGLVEALTDSEYRGLTRSTPVLFLSHAFRSENDTLISQIKALLSSFPISVVTGAKPATGSITEKVKGLIDDSDFTLAVLTKDEEQKDGSFAPSKWVYDEVAYVHGQKKTTILLLEEGADYKEGIAGDAEYIRFNRDNMSEAMVKLVTVLNGLLGS